MTKPEKLLLYKYAVIPRGDKLDLSNEINTIPQVLCNTKAQATYMASFWQFADIKKINTRPKPELEELKHKEVFALLSKWAEGNQCIPELLGFRYKLATAIVERFGSQPQLEELDYIKVWHTMCEQPFVYKDRRDLIKVAKAICQCFGSHKGKK